MVYMNLNSLIPVHPPVPSRREIGEGALHSFGTTSVHRLPELVESIRLLVHLAVFVADVYRRIFVIDGKMQGLDG